jgi:homopolymeric O-antigen transport system ATP-binding protein
VTAAPDRSGAELRAEGTACAIGREPEFLVEVEGVSKKYCRDFRRSLRYAFLDLGAGFLPGRDKTVLRPHEFWAVKDVSFRLARGESLGLIGDNGAGKSTLLKMLTGQRSLTAGRIVSRGRVVALMDLGLGFDPVLTGRENAYVNASVFGFSRRQLDPILEEIVDFAELREVIDASVQTYSTGMRARLAFSIATHLNPDILIVDEVLAVGDIHFRLKCVKHIQAYLKRGGSIILVSHDPFMVQTVCTRCIVLDKGLAIFDGNAVDGVHAHFQLEHSSHMDKLGKDPQPVNPVTDAGGQTAENNWLSSGGAGRPDPPLDDSGALSYLEPTPDGPVIIRSMEVNPVNGPDLTTNSAAIVTMRCRSLIEQEIGWAFNICTADMATSITTNGLGWERKGVLMKKGDNEFRCKVHNLPICPGVYGLRGAIVDLEALHPLFLFGYDSKPGFFTVKPETATLRANVQSSVNDLIALDNLEWLDLRSDAR